MDGMEILINLKFGGYLNFDSIEWTRVNYYYMLLMMAALNPVALLDGKKDGCYIPSYHAVNPTLGLFQQDYASCNSGQQHIYDGFSAFDTPIEFPMQPFLPPAYNPRSSSYNIAVASTKSIPSANSPLYAYQHAASRDILYPKDSTTMFVQDLSSP
jgi:hypothetical protein